MEPETYKDKKPYSLPIEVRFLMSISGVVFSVFIALLFLVYFLFTEPGPYNQSNILNILFFYISPFLALLFLFLPIKINVLKNYKIFIDSNTVTVFHALKRISVPRKDIVSASIYKRGNSFVLAQRLSLHFFIRDEETGKYTLKNIQMAFDKIDGLDQDMVLHTICNDQIATTHPGFADVNQGTLHIQE